MFHFGDSSCGPEFLCCAAPFDSLIDRFDLAMDIINTACEWIRARYSDIASVRATFHVSPTSLLLGSLCIYFAYILIYGSFFCSTRHIPGPFLTRFGKWYYYALLFGGSISADIHELHKIYGISN